MRASPLLSDDEIDKVIYLHMGWEEWEVCQGIHTGLTSSLF